MSRIRFMSSCPLTTLSLAPHYSCTSPTDCISHPPLHLSHSCHQSLICTNYTAALRQACFISLGLHLSHCEVLFSTVWHFRAVTPSVFPCLLPGLFLRLWPFAACLLTLPTFGYPLCLLPAPTIALPLFINLPCLRYTCYCYRTLPVWSPLVFILIKLHLDLNATEPSHYRTLN